MATRGYSGYKGRKSPWKIVAAILLVLVILGVGWLAASVLVVGGGLACLCGNTGNGVPCVGYGVVLVVVLALTRASA